MLLTDFLGSLLPFPDPAWVLAKEVGVVGSETWVFLPSLCLELSFLDSVVYLLEIYTDSEISPNSELKQTLYINGTLPGDLKVSLRNCGRVLNQD